MGGSQKTVLYESGMKLDFLEEIHHLPGGDRVKHCIQCGTCSGSCPLAWAMEETPRKIFALVRAGMRDRVLDSHTIWTCASCYQCAVRCPQQIKITDVMYALKRLSIQEGHRRSRRGQIFSRQFVEGVRRAGRNHETTLMVGYMLKANPFGAFKAAPIGLSLFTSGRLPLLGRSIKGIDGLRKIMARAEQLGGER